VRDGDGGGGESVGGNCVREDSEGSDETEVLIVVSGDGEGRGMGDYAGQRRPFGSIVGAVRFIANRAWGGKENGQWQRWHLRSGV
jgi:hypothetical protein